MNPATPVVKGTKFSETHFGANQADVQTLPAIQTREGIVISRWDLTEAEEDLLTSGKGSLYVCIWTANKGLRPFLPQVCTEEQMAAQLETEVPIRETVKSNGHLGPAQKEPADVLEAAFLDDRSPDDAPTNEAISVLFREIWDSQMGHPGYKERRWKELQRLLKLRGIEV